MNLYEKYFLSGKGIPFFYYVGNVLFGLIPGFILRARRRRLLSEWEKRQDADYIRQRAENACLLTEPFELGENAIPLSDIRPGRIKSRACFDLLRTLRYFPQHLRVNVYDGDIHENPKEPTLVKGRRLKEGKENAVLLNLDRLRICLQPRDRIPFRDKRDKLIFRGYTHGKPERRRFLEQWFGKPGFDLGDTDAGHPSPWYKPPISIPDHFGYKFVLTLEGNDWSSALPWVMASGCVPVMPRPTAEGWHCHSLMKPGVHYIEIASDFSDAGEKIAYYISHPDEAEKISMESKKFVEQFFDRRRELIISLLVMERYFSMSGQKIEK